jgi:hypothetical protein
VCEHLNAVLTTKPGQINDEVAYHEQVALNAKTRYCQDSNSAWRSPDRGTAELSILECFRRNPTSIQCRLPEILRDENQDSNLPIVLHQFNYAS